MRYRPEIDGLRAVSVLSVVLCHAGFSMFSGGFVGVDIFFVISGYLITTIVLTEIQTGTFCLANFYRKRALRIFPALTVVLVLSSPFAYFWLIPADLVRYAKSVIATLSFSSNFYFWLEAGYFDRSSELKPLLHTWSLAVEEQFYLLFPLCLMLLSKHVKKLKSTFGLIASASLFFSIWCSYQATVLGFYLLPSRAWQLLVGAQAAYYLINNPNFQPPIFFANVVTIFGLALIAFAVFEFDPSSQYPGVKAIIPTFGAVLVVVFSQHALIVKRILQTRLLAGIGLISYSVYLWHQPVFAFSRHMVLEDLSQVQKVLLSILIIVLAFLTWFLVERPARRLSLNLRNVFAIMVIISCGLGGLCFAILQLNGKVANSFLPESMLKSFEMSEMREKCSDLLLKPNGDEWKCLIGTSDASPSILVFGDSHALAQIEVLDSVLRSYGKAADFVSLSGCLPFLNTFRVGDPNSTCKNLNDKVARYIAHRKNIRNLILISRWTYYTDGNYTGDDSFAYVASVAGSEKSQSISRDAFIYGLRKTTEYYDELGVAISVVGQAPLQITHPQKLYPLAFRASRSEKTRSNYIKSKSITYDEHTRLQKFVNKHFFQALQENKLTYYTLDDVFCGPSRCQIGTATQSFYSDYDHLSLVGAAKVRGKIEQIINASKMK